MISEYECLHYANSPKELAGLEFLLSEPGYLSHWPVPAFRANAPVTTMEIRLAQHKIYLDFFDLLRWVRFPRRDIQLHDTSHSLHSLGEIEALRKLWNLDKLWQNTTEQGVETEIIAGVYQIFPKGDDNKPIGRGESALILLKSKQGVTKRINPAMLLAAFYQQNKSLNSPAATTSLSLREQLWGQR